MKYSKFALALTYLALMVANAYSAPGPAAIGKAIAEYDPATGSISVSFDHVNNWYIESASMSMTGNAPINLPQLGGLITDNDIRIGESAFAVGTAVDIDLGNVAATGLPSFNGKIPDLTIHWNAGLGAPGRTNPVCLAGVSCAAHTNTLWGTDLITKGAIVEISTETGAVDLYLGETRPHRITALAYDSVNSSLYGIDIINDVLVTIDTLTGTISSIGSLGIDTTRGGAAFDINSNTLYYTDDITSSLYAVDTSTGTASLVGGPLGISGSPEGLAFDPIANVLYLTTNRDGLYSVNRTTGVASFIANLSEDVTRHGLAFNVRDNMLYLAEDRNNTFIDSLLYTVDTTTGAMTAIGLIGENIAGLAFEDPALVPAPVPEPTTAALTLAATLCLAFIHGRSHRSGSNRSLNSTYACTSDVELRLLALLRARFSC